MLRIAIAYGHAAVVDILRKAVLGVPGYEVAWVARDGVEAVRKCAEDLPDLVLMGLAMPNLDGVQATRGIMKETPCAVLVVTPDVGGDAGMVFEAMGYGALDVVCIPKTGPAGGTEGETELLRKISRISKLVANRGNRVPPVDASPVCERPPLIAIGSSAGGPKALATIVSALPADYPGAVVIVQHIDAAFAPRLSEWLSEQTSMKVRPACRGAVLTAGTVWVAGGSEHLVMAPDRRLTFTPDPADAPYKPSIDAFFSSAAARWPDPALAVLLTGMGKDGAKGLLELRRAGWHTIAQDESTSVVYGMPRAAAIMGAAVEVLSLSEIITAIAQYARKARAAG